MEELRREFLRDTVSSFEILLNKFSSEKSLAASESMRRELFRRLHTVKGTAQTFGMSHCSALAHKIENLLQAAAERHFKPDENFKLLLLEGIGILLENFRRAETGQDLISPRAFFDKADDFMPESRADRSAADLLLRNIPPEFLAVLSSHETASLATGIENGNGFYLIAAFFEIAEFSEKFREFKNLLSERGEVIAAAAAPDSPPGTIGFRFYFTGRAQIESVKNFTEPYGARIVYPEETNRSAASSARFVLDQAARAGEQAAQALGKAVDFEIDAEELSLPARRLKILLEISTHLVRNAVDHAVETPEERNSAKKPERGKITLSLTEQANDLILRVTDDGRGIDAEKIRARARRQNLLAPEPSPSEEEILQTIFAHGFSTSETVTEISGRGVGLDAVKEAAEKEGGSVRVLSERGRGTTFEVCLPNENEPPRRGDAEKI